MWLLATVLLKKLPTISEIESGEGAREKRNWFKVRVKEERRGVELIMKRVYEQMKIFAVDLI
jgi:hypothetical protein